MLALQDGSHAQSHPALLERQWKHSAQCALALFQRLRGPSRPQPRWLWLAARHRGRVPPSISQGRHGALWEWQSSSGYLHRLPRSARLPALWALLRSPLFGGFLRSATRYRSWTYGFKGRRASHYTMAEPEFCPIFERFWKSMEDSAYRDSAWESPLPWLHVWNCPQCYFLPTGADPSRCGVGDLI